MTGDTTGERWAAQWRLPSPALRPFVAGYIGYRLWGGPPGTHRGLPSPYLTMIVAVDDPLTMVAHPDPRDAAGDYWTLVGGLHTTPALIGHPGRQSGIQVALRPLGVRALFGLPAGELSQRDVAGEDLLGATARELHERVAQADDWDRRFGAVDQVLLRGLRPDRAVRWEAAHVWRAIAQAHGDVQVAALAADVGWSTRHLETVLRTETGLGPKAAARVFRFDTAKRLIVSQPGNLADVAARCGYYDQAHLAREFRALAGCPPSQWLAEEFGNVQAMPSPTNDDGSHERIDSRAAGLADAARP